MNMKNLALQRTLFQLITLLAGVLIAYNFNFKWIIVLFIVYAIVVYLYEKSDSKRKNAKETQELMDRLCSSVIYLESNLNIKLRSHISLLDDDDYLRIQYEHNMKGESDRSIALSLGQGCMGQTWNSVKEGITVEGTFADLTISEQDGGPVWGIPPIEKAKINKKLKWVYTSPITTTIDKNNYIYALLTIDGMTKLTSSKNPSKSQRFKQVVIFGKALAFIISEMLIDMTEIKRMDKIKN